MGIVKSPDRRTGASNEIGGLPSFQNTNSICVTSTVSVAVTRPINVISEPASMRVGIGDKNRTSRKSDDPNDGVAVSSTCGSVGPCHGAIAVDSETMSLVAVLNGT